LVRYDVPMLRSRDQYPERLNSLKLQSANIDFLSPDLPRTPLDLPAGRLLLLFVGVWRRRRGFGWLASQHIPLVISRMIGRSVSRIPSLARVPTLRMVFSTPLTTMPSPP